MAGMRRSKRRDQVPIAGPEANHEQGGSEFPVWPQEVRDGSTDAEHVKRYEQELNLSGAEHVRGEIRENLRCAIWETEVDALDCRRTCSAGIRLSNVRNHAWPFVPLFRPAASACYRVSVYFHSKTPATTNDFHSRPGKSTSPHSHGARSQCDPCQRAGRDGGTNSGTS